MLVGPQTQSVPSLATAKYITTNFKLFTVSVSLQGARGSAALKSELLSMPMPLLLIDL